MQLSVNAEQRKILSASHSANPLAALALNKACKQFWSKTPILDSLSIQKSKIGEGDRLYSYRLGKSIRKTGLDTVEIPLNLDKIQLWINRQLISWLILKMPVTLSEKLFN
ncbi:MAG: hypothetical protein O3B21_15810 [Proteobacteria bacterium]|nr:hypothetical protein [Pseudomonadota bacterium]